MPLKTYPFDVADYLKTKRDVALYLEAVLEDGDIEHFMDAIGVIARSKGMSEISRATGLGRTSLYKTLSQEGNPEFATIVKVLKALGMRLSVTYEQSSDA